MVSDSVIFGLLSALGFGFTDLVTVMVVRKLGVLRGAVGINIAAVAVMTGYLFAAASLSQISLNQWAAFAGLAILGFLGYVCFYKALQLGPISLVTPIFSSYALVIIILAVIFSGERLSGGQSAAASVTIGGVILASLNPRGAQFRERWISKGVLLAIATMLSFGLWQYAIGVLSRDLGWFLPIYVTRLLMLGIFVPVVLLRREWRWQQLNRPLALGVIVAGMLETGAYLAFTRGSEIGVISIVAAASSGYPLVPIAAGLIIFRERLAPTQILGVVGVLVGLLVLGLNT